MAKKRFYSESEIIFKPISYHHQFQDLTRLVFGRLSVLGYAGKLNGKRSYWFCKCECGKVVAAMTSSLKNGETKSCGCFNIERIKDTHTKHGQSQKGKVTRTYRVWLHMNERCSNQRERGFKHYGGRGITVCERWRNFENFLADMGESPKGLSIERIDVNGNYEPSNCRWATQREQCRNKRNNHYITHKGKTKTMMEWAGEIGIKYSTLAARINTYKWPIWKALTPIVHKTL